ncbi:hypothetical protein ACTMTJ_08900 [Phytohabitans sp. LJ34]|uniref:hypothetical protein n=1 Tax=Phytohabitans sp. LJ34 TaxID=3452217 RepID=UPI003F8CC0D8
MWKALKFAGLSVAALLIVGLARTDAKGRDTDDIWSDAERIVLPFDQYRPTAAEQNVVNRATHILVDRCLHARGRPDIAVPASLIGAVEAMPDNIRRYGIVGERTARRFGYHFPADRDSDARAAHLDAWLSSLGGAEKAALYGTATRPGCLDDAVAALSRGVPEVDTNILTEFDFRSLDQSEVDPRVIAAVAFWRRCMSERGHRYEDPYDAVSDPRWDLDAPYVSEEEFATALADAGCKNRVDLVRIWVAVETDIQQGFIDENGARFAELARAHRATHDNALKAIDAASPAD